MNIHGRILFAKIELPIKKDYLTKHLVLTDIHSQCLENQMSSEIAFANF